jgi:hypothetical protein
MLVGHPEPAAATPTSRTNRRIRLRFSSLIGRLGSSTFRLPTTSVSMSLMSSTSGHASSAQAGRYFRPFDSQKRAFPGNIAKWRMIQLDSNLLRDAPDFVEVGEAGIAVDDAMRRQRRVQLVG